MSEPVEEPTACPHLSIDAEGDDPQVGIFGTAVWCGDCGAEALEFTEVWEPGEYGGFVRFDVAKWGPPQPPEDAATPLAEVRESLGWPA